ncbi:hypothetical protein WSK_2383 [Novosphingobium sp. Rr 2-17]|uniref:hypothetical protein n=1 Tax=Novosphingobium sp. Rr 2-17 TaxID=555793 RepID=UPI000269A50E|nr:hypothetical protein [Novosphingobium sp. Rr 2-17]EIZ78840.1 hypothetical protein WSK_2383 [Novosphingobium sp. Rr 2-17]
MNVLTFFAAIAILIPASALAVNRAQITPSEMMAAIRAADPAQLDDVDAANVTVSSIRVIRCIGSDEEPTEFECVWQTRSKGGWTNHKSWLAIDGRGWHFIN